MTRTVAAVEARAIEVTGTVQGVGFRPFVFGLAQRLGLAGEVCNTSSGVALVVEGAPQALDAFVAALREEAPPLARVARVLASPRPVAGFEQFVIGGSRVEAGAFQAVSPDVSICPDCLRELFEPADRRYRYPFINCTNCGPRFTIIKGMPYDRPQTTMAPFPLCPQCAAEYEDPLDRRFHAQPVACPDCGPQLQFVAGDDAASGNGSGMLDGASGDRALAAARRWLAAGRIVAVKGLGGFHLACDATDETAVQRLRSRKRRAQKPLAVMMVDVETAAHHCHVSAAEAELLQSRERPIVVLARRADSALAEAVAPGQATVGVMLPYTPLHYLLLETASDFPEALVMTSGNRRSEPIVVDNAQARERLAGLADAFLLHDRAIHTRCDDSVVRVAERDLPIFLRRSRGYAPGAVRLPRATPPLLAVGAELKNSFCLAREEQAFLSQYVGDLQNYETLRAFEQGVAHLEQLLPVAPQALVYDLHPDYLSTRYALQRAEAEGIPAIGVQHHHAHVAACMAEHGLSGERPVIGVSFDGAGYGEDGAIWGGEFLVADYGSYRRAAHLAYAPQPGGDKAAREPWRMALAWLRQAGVDWDDDLPPVRYAAGRPPALAALEGQLQSGINAPPTSSVGRLFDAAASLAGVCQVNGFEAQAAMGLEQMVDGAESGAYPFEWQGERVDPSPLLQALVRDVRAGVAAPVVAARFHNGLSQMVVQVCQALRRDTGLDGVALSGGVWQNAALLQRAMAGLAAAGFTVYVHRATPANDGGVALGQVAIGDRRLVD
ncbi:MAG TPA: carbamoyltransferase HypF [Candidatus Sulfomarinibacteraceae bacterium]|nr:carbamoyltransferase HypF [Candidatus Sulfomarinibacteraceae bacterium]